MKNEKNTTNMQANKKYTSIVGKPLAECPNLQ